MDLFEKYVSRREIFDGRIIKVLEDTVELSNGKSALREVVCHPGGVGIVAIDNDNNIYLVEQFRYPFNKVLLEIPAGKLEHGEAHYVTGKRELEEEVGLTSNDYTYLGCAYPSVGFLTEVIHLYLARDLTQTQQHLDEDEFLNVVKMPLAKAVELVINGEILDAKTQIGILKTSLLLK